MAQVLSYRSLRLALMSFRARSQRFPMLLGRIWPVIHQAEALGLVKGQTPDLRPLHDAPKPAFPEVPPSTPMTTAKEFTPFVFWGFSGARSNRVWVGIPRRGDWGPLRLAHRSGRGFTRDRLSNRLVMGWIFGRRSSSPFGP